MNFLQAIKNLFTPTNHGQEENPTEFAQVIRKGNELYPEETATAGITADPAEQLRLVIHPHPAVKYALSLNTQPKTPTVWGKLLDSPYESIKYNTINNRALPEEVLSAHLDRLDLANVEEDEEDFMLAIQRQKELVEDGLQPEQSIVERIEQVMDGYDPYTFGMDPQ